MVKEYYIINPFFEKKMIVKEKDLSRLLKVKEEVLKKVVNNYRFIKNVGYVVSIDTPEEIIEKLKNRKLWTRLTMPHECEYEISNYGDVRRILPSGEKSKKLKRQFNKEENRYYVNLALDGKRFRLYLDAAVMYHFSKDECDVYNGIEHIDGDISNLTFKNLRVIDDKMGHDECWKPIKGEGSTYEISNYGRIRTIESCRYKYLKHLVKNRSGNIYVNLAFKDGKRQCSLNRLVAEYFIEGFDKSITLAFKDGDKTNVYYKNLEFSNKRDIGKKTGHLSRNLPMVKCTEFTTGKVIGFYKSGKEAADKIGVCRKTIMDNLNGKREDVKDRYIFEYVQ